MSFSHRSIHLKKIRFQIEFIQFNTKMDSIVYELFGFTEEEIMIVAGG